MSMVEPSRCSTSAPRIPICSSGSDGSCTVDASDDGWHSCASIPTSNGPCSATLAWSAASTRGSRMSPSMMMEPGNSPYSTAQSSGHTVVNTIPAGLTPRAWAARNSPLTPQQIETMRRSLQRGGCVRSRRRRRAASSAPFANSGSWSGSRHDTNASRMVPTDS